MDNDSSVGIFFVLIFVLAIIPAAIARSKGRNFFLWYIYGWALFLIALIHALLLKSRRTESLSRVSEVAAYADALSKLADLREKGIITEAEFQTKKINLEE